MIYAEIKEEIAKTLGIEADFTVEGGKQHADYAVNAAMVLAKKFGKAPRVLAEEFAQKIKTLPFVEKCEVAGPGFINLWVKAGFLQEKLKNCMSAAYGFPNLGQGKKINIEFVSANPTGPLHIGHLRGAVYGDVLAELLAKTGFNITREYYINDGGGQISVLKKSVYIRYLQLLGQKVEVPEGCYPGEYLLDVARRIKDSHGDNLKEGDDIFETLSVQILLEEIKKDLQSLSIHHDVFTSEKAIKASGRIEKALEVLDSKGLLYHGFLPEPKGKKLPDWKPQELFLFRSTNFGDTEDRAIKKPDGSYTYFVPDIAYSKDKIDRGFNHMIIVLGADHLGFVSRAKAASLAIAQNPKEINWDAHLCQIVNFLEDGQAVKMSKRKGTFTTVREVLEEVHPDILRFIMLTKKNDLHLDFDLVKVKQQTKENPIFYIQYAFSRGSSILRSVEAFDQADLSLLSHPKEIDLIKKLLDFPYIIDLAARKFEPHHIAFYLYDLASEFHALWNLGNEEASLRFVVKNNQELTKSRCFLIKCLLNIISKGLSVFKIKPMEVM